MIDIQPQLKVGGFLLNEDTFLGRPRKPFGLTKLFGGVFASPKLATVGAYADSPATVMQMSENPKAKTGRKAFHAAKHRYMTMPLEGFRAIVSKHTTIMERDLTTWGEEVLTYLGEDLWGKPEDMPVQGVPKVFTTEKFWKDVEQRLQSISAWQNDSAASISIADWVVDKQTEEMVGVSRDGFNKTVEERLGKDGEVFTSLLLLHSRVYDLYRDTLFPEIAHRKKAERAEDEEDDLDIEAPPPGYFPE